MHECKQIVKKCVIFVASGVIWFANCRFFPLRIVAKLILFILLWMVQDRAYWLISEVINKKCHSRKKMFSSSRISLRYFFAQALLGNRENTPASKLYQLLIKTKPTARVQHDIMHCFMKAGRLDLTKIVFENLLAQGEPCEYLADKWLQLHRFAGTVCFMTGQNREANHYWEISGKLRKAAFKPTTPTNYRILGSNWFAAVGHVAMLDFYLKYKRLYGQTNQRIVTTPHPQLGCTVDLMRKFCQLGIEVINANELADDYDQWASDYRAPKWQQLSASEREAIIDDFWEHEFPDGQILSYTHAAARIQREWEESKRPPLLTVTLSEKTWLESFLFKLGMPSNAWFVCLHVREAGFHKKWNTHLPSLRDADITTYYAAIKEITDRGGWVVRMGDPSMKKLPEMPQVIDYAHSEHRCSFADMLLAASCRFFLGTNSGFATIPLIYGVPCALSNWVPIGWPLWASQDLMICKLFREKKTNRILSLEELFQRGLVFLQNCNDLPEDIELVANTAEDIRQLSQEMLSCFFPTPCSLFDVGAPLEIIQAYRDLAHHHDTFVGSRFAKSFVNNYPEVFTFCTQQEASSLNNLLTV